MPTGRRSVDFKLTPEQEKAYFEEIAQLRAEFREINTDNTDQLRAWLQKYAYLTYTDLIQITQASAWRVRQWCRRCGLAGSRPRRKKFEIAFEPDLTNPQPDNPQWLFEQVKRYGRWRVAQALGVNPHLIGSRLRRANLKLTTKQQHPCCNRHWLQEHYVDGLKSARDCAKLAGVVHQRIIEWLLHFGFRVRTRQEQVMITFARRYHGSD